MYILVFILEIVTKISYFITNIFLTNQIYFPTIYEIGSIFAYMTKNYIWIFIRCIFLKSTSWNYIWIHPPIQ